MTRHRHRAGSPLHLRAWLLAGVGAALAVILASSLGSTGTYALWEDFSQFRPVAVSAGQPALAVTGFDGLTHQYTAGELTKTVGSVKLRNAGNVALTGFDATRTVNDDDGLWLYSDVIWTFTREANGVTESADWEHWKSEWLSDLTLAPGQAAEYSVTTALSNATYLTSLGGKTAVSAVNISATAATHGTHVGTPWSMMAGAGFSQSVEVPTPEVDHPTNSMWFSYESNTPPWAHLYFVITDFPPGFQPSTWINFYASSGATSVLLGRRESFTYYPYFPIGTAELSAVAPQGTSVINVEAKLDNGTTIAMAPLWVTRAGGDIKLWGENPPPQSTSAPAPVAALAPPAPQPAVPQPAPPTQAPEPVAPEPEPVAPDPPSEPTAPEPTPQPEPAPAVPAEDEAEATTMTFALDWLSPAASIAGATVDDEPIDFELVDDLWTFAIPDRFWSGTREIELTGVDEHGADFAVTIRLTKGENGAITYEIVEPEIEEGI